MPTPNLNSENPDSWEGFMAGLEEEFKPETPETSDRAEFEDFRTAVAQAASAERQEQAACRSDQTEIGRQKDKLNSPEADPSKQILGEIEYHLNHQEHLKLCDSLRAWLAEEKALVDLPSDTKSSLEKYIQTTDQNIVIPGIRTISIRDLNFLANNIGKVEGKPTKQIRFPNMVLSDIDDELLQRLNTLRQEGKFAWGD